MFWQLAIVAGLLFALFPALRRLLGRVGWIVLGAALVVILAIMAQQQIG